MPRWPFISMFIAGVAFACGSSDSTGASSASSAGGGSVTSSSDASSTGAIGASTAASGPSSSASSSAGSGGAGGANGVPTAADLLKLVQSCNTVSNGDYKTDEDSNTATIPICGLDGAVFWNADMDIDCDGITTPQCNINTDPAYQAQTSATDSMGNYLDAASLPYVVVPSKSARFDYKAAGLSLGTVIAVIYNNQVVYGVFGDTGPSQIIGEASYATASLLGIDPDPSTGGTDSGVTYIAFTGASAVCNPIEDHQAATTLGQSLAAQLIANN